MPWQRPNIGSRMNREVHVRFWERPEVKVLRATRQSRTFQPRRSMSGLPPKAEAVGHWPLASMAPGTFQRLCITAPSDGARCNAAKAVALKNATEQRRTANLKR